MDSPGSMKRSRLLQRHLLPFLLLFLLLTLSQCRGDALPGTCAVAGECESGGDAEAAAMAGKDRVKIDEESAQDAKSRVDPYALLKDGHAKLKAKNFEEAITAYNQLDAVLSSIYGTMLHGRGVAHSMLQQHLQAAADFKQAVAKQPSKPEYWMELGQEYTILNDYENAHNAFTKAVELDPHNDKARRFRGMSAFEIEHYAAALGDLIPALTQDPSNPELLTQVAASLLRLNHYRESQPYWEEGVQAHPDDGNLWLQKGITHRILGEGQKAVDSLLMGLTVEENIEIYHNLAATRRYQGDHWGAIEWCDKGLAFRPEDSELLYVRASMHHALGDHATALAGYDHLMAMGAGRQMTFNQALAFYQREVLLYTVARLDLPFSAFQMDEDMDVDFKVAWLNRRVPPSLPKYHNLSVPDHQLEGATWQLLPQLSEGALAVIAAADEIGWRAHYETDGVMPNKQQLRMAGLAALDVMQRVRGTWEAIADEQRLPSIVDDDEDGEGEEERQRGADESDDEEGSDGLTSPPRMPLRRMTGSGNATLQLVGSWRQLFQVMVPWRQLSDPTEPPLWKAMFENQRFQGNFQSNTPIHTWKQFSAKYKAIYGRAVEVTRQGLLEGQEALDMDGNAFPVPRDTYGAKIEAAEGHVGLYNAVGRDFYLRLPCHSMALPGTVLRGTEFKLHKKPLAIHFETYTKNDETQWRHLDDELTAAWESLSAAVLDLPMRATDSSRYQQRVREGILRISYYWFQLMPLSRGSAMVGLISILGLSMAADMETTTRIPKDVLVDWEGLFATRFQDFYDAVAPWLFSSVRRSPWHLPVVREVLPTTRHVLAALSYT